MDSSTTVNIWERLWRSSGIIFGIFFVLAYVFYGLQPKIGASADTLVSPIIGLVWIMVFSGVLLTRRSPSTTPQVPEPPAAAPAS